MKWQEVRGLFPDQFVLVSMLNYHEEGNKKIVDEVTETIAHPKLPYAICKAALLAHFEFCNLPGEE